MYQFTMEGSKIILIVNVKCRSQELMYQLSMEGSNKLYFFQKLCTFYNVLLHI
jgi:hypothetical protein